MIFVARCPICNKKLFEAEYDDPAGPVTIATVCTRCPAPRLILRFVIGLVSSEQTC